MTKWEYNVVGGLNGFSQISEVFDAMNRLGAEGWELVDMDHDRGWAWFKRPIQHSIKEEYAMVAAQAEAEKVAG